VPRRRDKPRQVREVLATLSASLRVTIVFQGGPLDGVVLDGQSSDESERWDVAWLLVKTRGGELGKLCRAPARLWTQEGRASLVEYEVRSRAQNVEECWLFLVKNAEPVAAAVRGALRHPRV
jgi:hypothetical protein